MLSRVIFERLYNASAIVFVTGSGVSIESGLPSFHGEDGIWKGHKPQDLANLETFNSNHSLVWDWYRWRQEQIQKAKPNLAHYALVDFQDRFDEFAVITQNIDGLHQKAGSRKVLEVHGNIFNAVCVKCSHKIKNFMPDTSSPKCPECGNLLRPDVYWKGDQLDKKVLEEAQQVAAVCEVFFAVGTSGLVEPVSTLPFISKANGSFLIEINPKKSQLSDKVDERIEGKASEWLPKITIVYDKITGKS